MNILILIYKNKYLLKMPNKLTQYEVDENILKKCCELNYTLLNSIKYVNNKTKINLKCNNCEHTWLITYNHFINDNSKCAKCQKNLKLTQLEVEYNINLKCKEKQIILTKSFNYINNNSVLYLKCLICNHEWSTNYNNFCNKNTGCLMCSNKNITDKFRLNLEQAENNVNKKCTEKNYSLIKPFLYKNSYSTIYLKCNNCGFDEWEPKYIKFINHDQNCPKCSNIKKIQTIIDKYGIEYLKFLPKYNLNSIIYLNKISKLLDIEIKHALNGGEKILGKYFVDGYIEKYNICIEWNEMYHYSDKQIKIDSERKQYIIDNYNSKFIEINEKKFLSDPSKELNIIVKKIKELIKI